jgi:hypothetical protein
LFRIYRAEPLIRLFEGGDTCGILSGYEYRVIHNVPDVDFAMGFKGETVAIPMFGWACRQGCVAGNILPVVHSDFSNDDLARVEQSFDLGVKLFSRESFNY